MTRFERILPQNPGKRQGASTVNVKKEEVFYVHKSREVCDSHGWRTYSDLLEEFMRKHREEGLISQPIPPGVKADLTYRRKVRRRPPARPKSEAGCGFMNDWHLRLTARESGDLSLGEKEFLEKWPTLKVVAARHYRCNTSAVLILRSF